MAVTLALALALSAAPPDPAGDPFDLTYVPTEAPGRLVGVRPTALIAFGVTGAAADITMNAILAQVLAGIGGNPDGGKLPPVSDLSQLLCEGVGLSFPTADARGQFSLASGWYVVRTRDPFDWAGLATGWFPAGTPTEHAGHTYRRCPVKGEAFGAPDGESVELFFYPADPRTAVMSFREDTVKALIDRLKAGGKVTPPPLWDAVDRYPVALAASFADRSWLTIPDTLPPNRPGLVPFARLARAAGGLAVGAGPEADGLRLTAVVTADDLAGASGPLRQAAARTGRRPWLAVTAKRALASVWLSADDIKTGLAGAGPHDDE